MISGRWSFPRLAAITCLLVGVVDATAGPAIAGRLSSGPHRASALPSVPLLPGESHTGELTIAAPPVSAVPYLRVRHVQQRCSAACQTSGAPSLADVLTLTATDGGAASWRGSLSDLVHGVTLPGGPLERGHTRRYAITLSLPAQTGNAYQGLAVSADLEWGARAAAGTPAVKPGVGVLGESVRRGAAPQGQQSDGLPFTGFDAALSLVAGLALLGLGTVVVALARRLRRG